MISFKHLKKNFPDLAPKYYSAFRAEDCTELELLKVFSLADFFTVCSDGPYRYEIENFLHGKLKVGKEARAKIDMYLEGLLTKEEIIRPPTSMWLNRASDEELVHYFINKNFGYLYHKLPNKSWFDKRNFRKKLIC